MRQEHRTRAGARGGGAALTSLAASAPSQHVGGDGDAVVVATNGHSG